MKSKNIVLEGIYDARLRQKAIEKEQNRLLEKNKKLFEEKAQDITGEQFADLVKVDIDEDLIAIDQINSTIAAYQDKSKLHFGVKTNKMKEILLGAKHFLGERGDNVVKFAQGQLPSNYDNRVTSELPSLDWASTDITNAPYYGTSKASFVSAALLSTYFSLTNKKISNLDFINSAITHIAPLPDDFKLNTNFRFSYNSDAIKGFGYMHSGYTFGGHRFQENLYPQGKFLAPEDCSSWVSKMLGNSHVVTTADQYCAYRINAKSSFTPPKDWEKQDMAQYLINGFDNINVENIEVGDVYMHRKFKEATHGESDLGVGGHTTIVLEKPISKELKTIGANRDMPKMEAVGIQTFSLEQDALKDICFVRVKDEYLKDLPFYDIIKDLPDDALQNLPKVVEYFDSKILDQLGEIGEGY
jgi:hypothetical protein